MCKKKRAFLCNFVYLFSVLHAGIAILSVHKTRFLCFIGVHNMDFLFIHAGIVTRSVHFKKNTGFRVLDMLGLSLCSMYNTEKP